MRLFIVRHGESVWNAEGRFQGQHDTELSRRGFEQGLKVAEFLKRQRFDAVATSPLKRSSVTARKIAEMSGCDVIEELSGLTEICHGDWETCLTNEVIERWPRLFDLWHSEPHTVVMPGRGGSRFATSKGARFRQRSFWHRNIPATSASFPTTSR